MNLFKIAFAAAALALAVPAAAQFPQSVDSSSAVVPALPSSATKAGGPVAVGQMQAQVDPQTQKVTIIQAAPEPAKSGGVIQLSAFGWLQPYADTLAQFLITAGFAWFAKSRYSAMLDKDSRETLEAFAKNRASSLIADGAVRIQGKAIHVDNGFLYRAASESATAIPDALKRFKLSPEVVAQKIIDAIPQTPAGAAIVADAHKESPDINPEAVSRPGAAPGNFVPPVAA